jgi:hypothetical protein
MWLDVGRDWGQATGPDLQENTITAIRHLRYNNLSTGGPEEDLGKWKITHQLLVQTHTRNTPRPSRIWTRCSTVKYRDTLDANQKGGVCDYPPLVTAKLLFLMLVSMNWVRTMTQYKFYSFFCDNRSYVSTFELSVSVRRVETNTGLYEINIISNEKRTNLYSHLERNVMVQLRVKFRVASYFL